MDSRRRSATIATTGQRRAPRDASQVRATVHTSKVNGIITLSACGIALIGSIALWFLWSTPARNAPLAPDPVAPPPIAPPHRAAAPPQPSVARPVASSEPKAGSVAHAFVRGIDLGGEEVTIDGRRWLGHAQALENGLELGVGTALAPRAPIQARLDFDTKAMLESGIAAVGPVQFTQRLPNGEYEIALWAAGVEPLDVKRLKIRLAGVDQAIGPVAARAVWSWLGPYPVTVDHHALEVTVEGLGTAHLSGVTISPVSPGDAQIPPVISLLSPAAGAPIYSGDIPLLVDVMPGNGPAAQVTYFDRGLAIGTASAAPYRVMWHQPTPGEHRLSATATDGSGVSASTRSVPVTIKSDDGSPELVLERAQVAMRAHGLDPSAIVQDATGMHAHLARATLPDLAFLKGLPLTDVDLNDGTIGDLSALSGMALRRLLLNNVQVRDFSFLAGMPLTELHVANCGLTDFAPLAGMPLAVLEAGNNPVSDLRPLAGLPLHFLFIQNTRVADLSAVIGMPLEELDAGSTKVQDLAPLAQLPLRRLLIGRCSVFSLAPLAKLPLKSLGLTAVHADFTPLKGLALEEAWLGEASISDLSPLAGMPLRLLDIGSCPVPSLAPLAGSGLQVLLMGSTPVSDLASLAQLPLVELDLHDCGQVRSLAPLAHVTTMRRLALPPQEPDIDQLMDIPELLVRGKHSDSAIDIKTYRRSSTANHK